MMEWLWFVCGEALGSFGGKGTGICTFIWGLMNGLGWLFEGKGMVW